MRIEMIRPGRVAGLVSRAEAVAARVSAIASEAVPASRAALIATVLSVAAVVTGVLRPLPWQLHLAAPLVVGSVGWALARRWGDRPVVVLWGMLGLATGISAAQQLGTPMLAVPLASVGTLLGVVVARTPAP